MPNATQGKEWDMLKREARANSLESASMTEEGERVCALVRNAGAGDEHAWSELVSRYDRLVRHVVRAHGIDSSTSEDIVQVTWCRLVQNLDRVRQPDRLGAWLARTARNECLHVLRSWGRETPVDDGTLYALVDEVDDADDCDPAGLEDVVMRAFHTLDEDQRFLLRLVLLTEPKPSYEQIGAALGRPVGSIGPTLGRCIDKLRVATLRISAADKSPRAVNGLS
jgi:RNA polymerase sigma factor (sigma-70 family)